MSKCEMLIAGFLILLAHVTIAGAQDPEADYRKQVDAIVQKYDESRAKAKSLVLKSFDLQISSLEKSAKKDIKVRDTLESTLEAKENFKELDRLPKRSVLTRDFDKFEQQTKAALNKAVQEIERLANKANAKGLPDLAKDILSESESLKSTFVEYFPVRCLYRIVHVVDGRDRNNWGLYSDGTVDKNPSRTWCFESSNLIIRSKDPGAPGGFWIDTCRINSNFDGFDGSNQQGNRISGSMQLVDE
jgi:hypothetical protein